MTKKLNIAAVICGIVGSLTAASAATPVSFDQLKQACQDPTRFRNQIAPKNIEVSCADSLSRYVPIAAGKIALPVSRAVTTSVASDKYTMAATTEAVKMADEEASCPQFSKIVENVSLTRQVTCEEIIAFQGTSTEYCLGQINEMRAANPAAVQITNTESVVSLCEKSEGGRDQRDQRAQSSQSSAKKQR